MSNKARKGAMVDPFMRKISKLTRKDRVSLAVDISSVAMEITLGSLADLHMFISGRLSLTIARNVI